MYEKYCQTREEICLAAYVTRFCKKGVGVTEIAQVPKLNQEHGPVEKKLLQQP